MEEEKNSGDLKISEVIKRTKTKNLIPNSSLS